MGKKSLTSRCRCSSRAGNRSYPRRCVSCRRLCAKWSYVCSQHVCKVAPLLWEATSEPLIHFSTVRPGERWISQQIQVSICNKHFTSHCTHRAPPRGGEGGVGGGGSCRCQSPLAALPCGSGVTQLNTVAATSGAQFKVSVQDFLPRNVWSLLPARKISHSESTGLIWFD